MNQQLETETPNRMKQSDPNHQRYDKESNPCQDITQRLTALATRTMTVPGTKAVLPAATINSSLTNIGVLWAILSLSSAVLSGVGFYLPFWIQGEIFNRTTVYFGSFRRCNYPRLLENGRLEIVLECGRYASFSSIPSAAWRAASVLIGIAASLALLVAFIALIGCFTADAVNSFLAKTLGFIQLVAGLFVAAGLGLYPLGYGNPQVKEACGDISEPFHLGPKCKYSWSLYMLSVATLSLWLCSALSLKASRMTPHFYRI
ncbi:lipoma HMGIC fusion partner-like isoform X5 [Varroa jacobsoni]|uniref:lipoma HMGIC fusion partner-like isoform X5 n=1 Tax=Varroa jacobsoni TaxID=62625 RepID=UPI000BFA2C23|nr:lipoma HMGIC fusion partner-like isoform X5 [Varroa jacobsoni]XP_022704699.1 lipoma HMGIC fusion partner-like isoform X5 [Varroa jacobsoni]XP_022704700.1 lipoma HMGIC fusion partner-like isoform X5 [Varroa jacobsoni]XP_022704701.1 lipoma HMGIC fusion partner-like isoform X5 [Varroa jacobsoni]